MAAPDTLPPAALLAHAHFVRRLAGSLVRDDVEADDVAQEALTRSLGRLPADPRRTRPWLVRTVRNVARRGWRDEARRGRRERTAARPEGTEGPVDLLIREETLRAVVDALATLDPAHRAVVLLRHYDGLPPRDIAARLGEPVETVKSRLKRAHERLREQLDRAERPGKGTWRAVLFDFAPGGDFAPGAKSLGAPGNSVVGGGAGTAVTAMGGAMAMTTGAKVGIAAAVVLLLGGTTWGILAATSTSGAKEGGAPPAVAKVDPAAPPTAADAAGLAAKPAGAGPAKPAVVAAPKERPIADGWTRLDLARVVVDVPATWTLSSPDRSQGTASWYVGTPDQNATLMAAIARLDAAGTAKLRSQLTVDEERRVTVDGRPATWLRGTSEKVPGGTIWFVALDTADPDGNTYAWMVRMREGSVAETTRTLEGVLGSVRFLAAAAMTGEATLAEIQKAMFASTPTDVLEVVVLGGTRGVGWTVSVAPDASAPPRADAAAAPPSQPVGPDGIARVSGVPSGAWRVSVRSPDGVERSLSVTMPRNPKGDHPLVVALGTAVLEGGVHGREGEPLRDHPLRLINTKAINEPPIVVRTNSEGHYRITELRAGGYQYRDVLLSKDGLDVDAREGFVAVAPGDHATLDIGSPTPEPRWTGTIRLASGTPLHGPSSISLMSAAGGSAHSIFFDEAGRVTQRLPTGTYRVWISPAGLMKSPPPFQLTMPEKDLAYDIAVPGVRVSGVLRDGATGRAFPLAGPGNMPSIHLASLESPHTPPLASVVPGANGIYLVDGVPVGRYRAYAMMPGTRYAHGKEVDIVVPADRDVTGIDLEVEDQ